MKLWIMLGAAAVVMGCTDSVQHNDAKREMDRISYRNSALLRQVDEQNDRINTLELELQRARAQVQSLQRQQHTPASSPTTIGPTR